MRVVLLTLTTCLFVLPTYAKYAGGSGTAQDPYQIATAADLILLGESPEDYGRHFILIADIDLDPNLPGRKVFDRAVIAPDTGSWEPKGFTGTFKGNGRMILHLTIRGGGCLGLFGALRSRGRIEGLGLVDVDITGSGLSVGGLVGQSSGNPACSVVHCYSTGRVSGGEDVGGLVGGGSWCDFTGCYSAVAVSGSRYVGGLIGCTGRWDSVTRCYSDGVVSGLEIIGGLAGANYARVTQCHSTSRVHGQNEVGGLVGWNWGDVIQCYSTGAVSGDYSRIGGLVGRNQGDVTQCYSTELVQGSEFVGGLVGYNLGEQYDYRAGSVTDCFSTSEVRGRSTVGGLAGCNGGTVARCYSNGAVTGINSVGGLVGQGSGGAAKCFWDTQTSGQATSAGGKGKTTLEMQAAQTFLEAGWDLIGETTNGTKEILVDSRRRVLPLAVGSYPTARLVAVSQGWHE